MCSKCIVWKKLDANLMRGKFLQRVTYDGVIVRVTTRCWQQVTDER